MTQSSDFQNLYSKEDLVTHYAEFTRLYKPEKIVFEKFFDSAKGKKILDVGCGAGRTSKVLFDLGMDVKAVDISDKMIGVAKKKYPEISFNVMDATKLAYDDNTFDYVLFSFNGLDCIYPYEERLKTLTKLYDIIKPGGLFIYSSHNSTCFITRRKSRLRNLFRNLVSLKIFCHYRNIVDQVEGKVSYFYQNPLLQKRTLIKLGFKDVRIYGNYELLLRAMFCDDWLYYVARKPGQ